MGDIWRVARDARFFPLPREAISAYWARKISAISTRVVGQIFSESKIEIPTLMCHFLMSVNF
jgi:hypothetical protein